MMTFRKFLSGLESVSVGTAWYLADLGEAKGRQELFTRQSPQRLKALREHALIESAVSSNRIEGVEVDKKRIATIIFGRPILRDRNEEEVAGYRQALKWIHEKGPKIPISEATIHELHRMARGEIWEAGKYKEKDSDIIERYADGGLRVRFKTVSAKKVPKAMEELISGWNECLKEQRAHPLLGLCAFNLDFLCIHPFRDGNGRVSRLLLLQQCYHLGFEVGRYVSLERLIEQNKERYYETLEQSSEDWHQGKHDPWPYINYMLFILKTAYREFEERIGQVKAPRGEKTKLVIRAINQSPEIFRIADLQAAVPGVSVDLIRKLLKDLRGQGKLECLGRGQSASWRKIKNGEVGNTY